MKQIHDLMREDREARERMRREVEEVDQTTARHVAVFDRAARSILREEEQERLFRAGFEAGLARARAEQTGELH